MLQLSSTALFCGRAKPPRTAALRRGRTFKGAEPMRRGLLLFLFAEPLVLDSAGARLASPIARPIGSPPAKPASPGLASGFGAAGRRTGQSEAGLLGFVRGPKRDAPDSADRDDYLPLVHAQGEEPKPRLARERAQGQMLAVGQLDLDVRALRRMRCRVLLDLAVDPSDEIVERRLRRARDP